MHTLQTPLTLSQKPFSAQFPLPAYDWNKQTRHDTVTAGGWTSGSTQTFDGQGKPSDSKGDNND